MSKITKKPFLFFIVASLAILPHCAKYKPTTLPAPQGTAQKDEHVTVITRKLSPQECKTCFDSKELANHYDAIQIYVKNKNNKSVVLSATNIDLPIESNKKVSEKIHRKTGRRVAAYGAGGILLWPLLIPATVDGVKSSNANTLVDQDVSKKVLGKNEQEIIKPYNELNKIVLVPRKKNCKNFNLKLTNQHYSKEQEFSCQV